MLDIEYLRTSVHDMEIPRPMVKASPHRKSIVTLFDRGKKPISKSTKTTTWRKFRQGIFFSGHGLTSVRCDGCSSRIRHSFTSHVPLIFGGKPISPHSSPLRIGFLFGRFQSHEFFRVWHLGEQGLLVPPHKFGISQDISQKGLGRNGRRMSADHSRLRPLSSSSRSQGKRSPYRMISCHIVANVIKIKYCWFEVCILKEKKATWIFLCHHTF